MASPFKLFRKYQWLLLVVFGGVLMVVFVIGDALLPFVQGGGARPGDDVVVQTAYGNLHQSDMQELNSRRIRVRRFDEEMLRIADPSLEQNPAELQYQLDSKFLPAATPFIVAAYVLNHLADEMDVEISDAAINDYIRQRSDGKADYQDFERIKQQMNDLGVTRVTDNLLFEDLRYELRAVEMMRVLRGSAGAVPPGRQMDLDYLLRVSDLLLPSQQYELISQLASEAEVEALSLPIAELEKQIEAPESDTPLRRLFDQYKDVRPTPDSNKPGFRVPPQIKLEYLEAQFDQFAKANVTEEEIKAYYEENKDRDYKESFTPSFQPPEAQTQPPASRPTPPGPQTPIEPPMPEGETPAEPKEPAKQPAEATEPPAEDEKETSEASQAPAEEKQQPAEEEPATETKPETETKEDQQSSLLPFPLSQVAFLQAEAEPAKDEKPEAKESKPEDAKQEPKPEEDPQQQPTAAEPKSAEPTEEPKEPAEPEEPKVPVRPIEDLSLDRFYALEKPERYRPLDDRIRGQIRTILAGPLFKEKVEEVFAEIQKEMNLYGQKYASWEAAEKEGKLEVPKPEPLALGKYEEKYPWLQHFSSQENYTPLEIQDTPKLGEAVLINNSRKSLLAELFQTRDRLYVPLQAVVQQRNEAGNRFLVWKTDYIPEHVPEFEEVRDEVVTAWKHQQAMDKARELAEEVVKAAKEQSLAEVLEGDLKTKLREALGEKVSLEVEKPEAFTWKRPLAPIPNVPVVNSSVLGMQDPGDGFMKRVFGLKDGEATMATNQQETNLFVVRMIRRSDPSASLLRDPENTNGFQALIQQTLRDRLLPEALQYGILFDREFYEFIENRGGVKYVQPQGR